MAECSERRQVVTIITLSCTMRHGLKLLWTLTLKDALRTGGRHDDVVSARSVD